MLLLEIRQISIGLATTLEYQDMTTVTVNEKIEGKIGKDFVVLVKDGNGNPLINKSVQIGFNGKVYDLTTDDKGYVKLQINLGYAGAYTFAICFLGDDAYNASFGVAKITVKAQTPKLTTQKVSYKAAAKTKTIKAIFKTAKGNAIADKWVTFTVNGKTYKAKTNAKGVASVNVSLTKKGTYNFTVKYAGDSTYAAVSAKSSIVIK